MSEDQKPPEPKTQETIKFEIMVDLKNNRVFVSGPIHLKALALHALADAINVIIDHEVVVSPIAQKPLLKM